MQSFAGPPCNGLVNSCEAKRRMACLRTAGNDVSIGESVCSAGCGRRPPKATPAVEVLSNRAAEMRIKLEEYFQAGVQVVWLIDHRTRTARLHTAPKTFTEIGERGSLTPAAALPGFKLRQKTLLDEALDVE